MKYNYLVIYCNKFEPNRFWKTKLGRYKRTFLNSSPIKFGSSYTYLNFSIINKLNTFKPDVLIINGNSIPMFLAFVWGKIYRKKLILTSDTNIFVEQKMKLNIFQIFIRKITYPFYDAYIGTSKKTISLYKKYGAKKNFFVSPLAIDVKKKIQNIQIKLKNSLPTIPSTLKEELDCNIFLRAKDLKTFSKLRDLKDNF